MYNLIGMREEIINENDDGFEFEKVVNVVATFDKKEDAEAYVEASKLSTYNRVWCTWRDVGRQFRKSSLLRNYTHFEIEEHVPESPPPHNPKIL